MDRGILNQNLYWYRNVRIIGCIFILSEDIDNKLILAGVMRQGVHRGMI